MIAAAVSSGSRSLMGAATRTAWSAPIDIAYRNCSSASAGPTVSTPALPPVRSAIRTASSTAHSSCGPIVKPRWRVSISVASSVSRISAPTAGTRLTHTRTSIPPSALSHASARRRGRTAGCDPPGRR